MLVIAFEQRLRRVPLRLAAARSDRRNQTAANRLTLDSYAQGRPLHRAVTETLVTVALVAATIAAFLIAQARL
jgi:hypothetical protein